MTPLVPSELPPLADAVAGAIKPRCADCGWYFTNGRCRRCTALGAPIGTLTDPGSPDPGQRADGAVNASGEAPSAPPMPAADGVEQCPACGWYRPAGVGECVRCARLGPPREPQDSGPGVEALEVGCDLPGVEATESAGAGKTPSPSPCETDAPLATMPGKNGGWLRRGNPGNKGGGQQPDAIRSLLREFAWDRLPELLDSWPGLEHDQRVELMDRLALKYGVGTQREVLTRDDARTRLLETLTRLRGFVPEDRYEAMIAAIEPVWT